jgi:uncharacterized membrane protein YjgN (DUF898 family)
METETSENRLGSGFEFRGQSKEYFKIWITNLFLNLITLSLYSAWAKVRSKRYFYGNTFFEGKSFEYHADPRKIFKGRLIITLFFISFTTASYFIPEINYAFYPLLIIAGPFLLVKGMIFNLTNSSYSNVHFGFEKDFKGAYLMTFRYMLLNIFTLGLGIPAAEYYRTKFIITKSKFGNLDFDFKASIKDFYIIALKTLIVFVLTASFFALILSLLPKLFPYFVFLSHLTLPLILAFGAVLALFLVPFYYIAERNILVWRNTKVGEMSFYSSMNIASYSYIFGTNVLLSTLSLGFLIPWTIIRMTNYKMSCLTLRVDRESYKSIVSKDQKSGGVMAETINDFWDIDVEFN